MFCVQGSHIGRRFGDNSERARPTQVHDMVQEEEPQVLQVGDVRAHGEARLGRRHHLVAMGTSHAEER